MKMTAIQRVGTVSTLFALTVFVLGCGDSDNSEFSQYSLDESAEKTNQGAETTAADTTEESKADDVKEPVTDTDVADTKTETDEVIENADTQLKQADVKQDAEKVEVTSNDQDTKESKSNGSEPIALGPDPRALSSNPLRPALGPPPEPREIKLLVKDRKFKVEGPEDALRISYDDFDLLKVLNMEPVTMDAPKLMPEWLTQLEGKRIRVRGFMYPPLQEQGLTGFVLARDNQICCFGRDPKPYDIVQVDMRKGHTTNYILNRPFDVVGIFHIDPIDLDGSVRMVYRIDDATVIEK